MNAQLIEIEICDCWRVCICIIINWSYVYKNKFYIELFSLKLFSKKLRENKVLQTFLFCKTKQNIVWHVFQRVFYRKYCFLEHYFL